MKILQGSSASDDADLALTEATAGWDEQPEMVWMFASTKQDPVALVAAFQERFPGVPLAGCTTAGEHLSGRHDTGTVVLTGLVGSGMRFAVTTVTGLADLGPAQVRRAVDGLLAELGCAAEDLTDGRGVGLLFVDGLRGVEEQLTAVVADALEGVRLVGGSAGDDLAFRQTWVFGPTGAATDAATLVLVRAAPDAPIQILKHQHFTRTPSLLTVTRAEGRTVHELDGYPANEAYARALGVELSALTPALAFQNPVTFACDGQLYVRSVQRVNPDGSITFYCAVEEGMVLGIGGHRDMIEALAESWRTGFTAPPALVLGFNCILRALEATDAGLHPRLGETLLTGCGAFIGFDTYGEQLDGLHINQTLVAVGFGRAAA